jgi:hypothetical protein
VFGRSGQAERAVEVLSGAIVVAGVMRHPARDFADRAGGGEQFRSGCRVEADEARCNVDREVADCRLVKVSAAVASVGQPKRVRHGPDGGHCRVGLGRIIRKRRAAASRATESQGVVVGNAEDMTQSGAIRRGWPADDTTFELGQVMSVDFVDAFRGGEEPRIRGVGQFAAAHRFSGEIRRLSSFSSCPELIVWLAHHDLPPIEPSVTGVNTGRAEIVEGCPNIPRELLSPDWRRPRNLDGMGEVNLEELVIWCAVEMDPLGKVTLRRGPACTWEDAEELCRLIVDGDRDVCDGSVSEAGFTGRSGPM